MRAFAGLLLITVLPAFSQPAKPFTVIEVSRPFDEHGQPSDESRFLFARNRDGQSSTSILMRRHSADLDPVKRRSILVDPTQSRLLCRCGAVGLKHRMRANRDSGPSSERLFSTINSLAIFRASHCSGFQ